MRVLIGNSAAKERRPGPDGASVEVLLPGRRITHVVIPDDYTLMEAAKTITEPDGVWNNHSAGSSVSDSVPDWIESDRAELATILADHFGVPVGRPDGWAEDISDPPAGDQAVDEGAGEAGDPA